MILNFNEHCLAKKQKKQVLHIVTKCLQKHIATKTLENLFFYNIILANTTA